MARYTLALNPATGTLEIVQMGSGGGGTISGTIAANQVAFGTAADTIGGTDKLTYDGASALTLQTLTNADTTDTVLTLGVHANEGDAAALSVLVDGASGNNTPDTIFTFPGAAILSANTDVTLALGAYSALFIGFGFFSFGDNVYPTATDSSVGFSVSSGPNVNLQTLTDANTNNAALNLDVHSDEADAAGFSLVLDGAGGSTPNTAFVFPGAALFTDASGYSFDNTIIPGSFAFASLPTAATGMMATVTDSNTATWGATIAGGGANNVQARYNGANWTVVGV